MSFKPKTPGSMGGAAHKRPSEHNQQVAKAVRPQLPRDGSADGKNNVQSCMPPGFVSVWDFGNGQQTKWSPVSVKQKKVY